MLNKCQFLCVPTPPSAAAGSSKEVKLRKTCGRPILECCGGTRIHNCLRLAIFFVWQYLWGRGKHDPSRHLSPDRRTRMGRRKISSTLLNTLMCGEIGRISRVGSFVDKNDVKFWLMSSFASAAAKLHYELSLEIQKYRLQCGRIYEIGERIYEIMGKFWELLPTAYGMRPHFWAYAFWSSGKPLLPGCGCVLIIDAYSFVPPPAAVIGISIHLLCSPEAKIDVFQTVKNCSISIKIHFKPFKIDKNSF